VNLLEISPVILFDRASISGAVAQMITWIRITWSYLELGAGA